MENNSSGIIILLFLCFGIIIWIYIKYNNEKENVERISKERNKLAKANAQLIADNALLESEQLKFQLQPHTLNNILANLKSIANKLNKGMDSLSDTLEYILYKGNTHLVSVQDELEFIKKYLALNDLFISEIDSIKLDLSKINKHSDKFSSHCIPHLISAYLIENAFKHGDVNHPEFLKIHIILTNESFEMHVTNRLKQKPNVKLGGIGLINMRKRLELLMPGRYNVKMSCNEIEYYSSLIINF